MRYLLLLLSFIFFIGCNNSISKNGNYNENDKVYYSDEYGYKDGVYCAEVVYYYSKTGTWSTYTLEVEIENNELTIIHWPNGGWLDDTHFYPPDISDGYAEFESDNGVEYTVEIVGEEGDCYLSSSAPNESSFIDNEEEQICSRCGSKKYSFDDFCDDCTDEIENTCSRCGLYEYGVNGGLCFSCQEDNENDNW